MFKGSKRTEEANKKAVETRKNNNSYIAWNKGVPCREETKRKLSLFNKGKRLSKETIEKMSLSRTGEKSPMWGKHHSEESKRKNSTSHKGKIAWNKGLKNWMSEEGKARMIASKRGKPTSSRGKKRPEFSGSKHWNWKGGRNSVNDTIRKSLEYKLWRKAVFERDNFTCIWCGQRGGKLNADHIKPFAYFPELRFAIDNGRTLCIECHKKTNTFAGKAKKYKESL